MRRGGQLAGIAGGIVTWRRLWRKAHRGRMRRTPASPFWRSRPASMA